MTFERRSAASRTKGFTILELVVAVAIFTIVVGAIYAVLAIGRSDTFTSNERSEILQNARVALETIRRDANNAGDGFWKSGARVPNLALNTLMYLNRPNDGIADSVTPVVPGNNVVNITVDGATVPTDVVAFVYADNSFNNQLGDVGITAVNKTTNVCTLDIANATSVFAINRAYVIDDGASPAIGICRAIPSGSTIQFAAGDPLGINVTGASGTLQNLPTTSSNAACRELNWVVYYVDSATNTLMRRSFGSLTDQLGNGVPAPSTYPGYVTMPLAFNVENFQCQYVLDSGETLDDITADTDWARIRMVRVTVSVRGTDPDPRSGQINRESLTSVFFTRNLANQERPPAS